MHRHKARIKARARKGVPDACRGQAWKLLCNAEDGLRRREPDLYTRLTGQAVPKKKSELDKVFEAISRDIARTFPQHDIFLDAEGIGQARVTSLRAPLKSPNSHPISSRSGRRCSAKF